MWLLAMVDQGSPESAGDALVAKMLDGSDTTGLAFDLWGEVSRGYPVERMVPLFKSDLESAVSEGVWLAAELGPVARPLLRDIVPLLSHPSPAVRGRAVEAIGRAAASNDSEIIARAAERILDDHLGVRGEVVQLLVLQPEDQLAAAQPHLLDRDVGSAVTRLLEECHDSDTASARSRLGCADRTERLIALATLMRIREGAPGALLIDVADADPEVERLAQRYVRDRT